MVVAHSAVSVEHIHILVAGALLLDHGFVRHDHAVGFAKVKRGASEHAREYTPVGVAESDLDTECTASGVDCRHYCAYDS